MNNLLNDIKEEIKEVLKDRYVYLRKAQAYIEGLKEALQKLWPEIEKELQAKFQNPRTRVFSIFAQLSRTNFMVIKIYKSGDIKITFFKNVTHKFVKPWDNSADYWIYLLS